MLASSLLSKGSLGNRQPGGSRRLSLLELRVTKDHISSILAEAQPFLPQPQVTRTLMITYVPTEIQDPEVISKHFQ